MFKGNGKTLYTTIALAVAFPANAADPLAVPGGVASPITAPAPVVRPADAQISDSTRMTAAEIQRANERISVLSARLQELELQAKISKQQDEISKARSSGLDTTVLPVVTGISGVDGVLKATLMEQNGRTQSAKIGDQVGAWKITDIQMDSVTVKQGKKAVKLSFGSYQSTTQAQTPNPGFPGVPAIPQ